jgi:hypothetical protein
MGRMGRGGEVDGGGDEGWIGEEMRWEGKGSNGGLMGNLTGNARA